VALVKVMNDKIKIYNRMNYPSPNLPIIPQTKNLAGIGEIITQKFKFEVIL
jgi:hypothetical protein